ncbi:MAG: MFS transporter [Pirellulaceae bacterium]
MDEGSHRWRILVLLSFAELFGMSLWLTASAVSEQLAAGWNLTNDQVSSLTTAVQMGFVVGTAFAALFNLADIISSRFYFAVCALLASAANAGILAVDSYMAALSCRFLVGLFLAGVYPPAMKMIATWYRSSRGFAIGTIVGALTCGKAMPYLLSAVAPDDHVGVIVSSSIAAAFAGLLVLAFYRDGPHAFPSRKFRLALIVNVIRHRPTRLAVAGYLGHMWELYAMWVWIPKFIRASFLISGGTVRAASLAAFLAIATGAVGCLWGGWVADRIGREKLVNLCMLVSGICSIGIGFSFGGQPWIVAIMAAVWGFFVVADSAQFSTMVTEVSAPENVGTALTLQTSLGFLLTMVTIEGVDVLRSYVGWKWAFAGLAIGPFLGIAAISKLRGERPTEENAS